MTTQPRLTAWDESNHLPKFSKGVKACGATYIPANGEYVSPCRLHEGHKGQHEGWCLGSKAVWTSDRKHTVEGEPE